MKLGTDKRKKINPIKVKEGKIREFFTKGLRNEVTGEPVI